MPKSTTTATGERTDIRSDALVALMVGLVALAFSAYQIDFKSLWMDEALTLNATASWTDFPTRMMELHGGSWLYYVAFMPWRMWAHDEWQLRLFSALFAAATAGLLYLAGRRLADRSLGIIAGLLFATHPLVVEHGQDTRVYTMLMLLVTAQAIVLLKALETGRWRDWLGFSLLCMLAFSAHYFSILAVVAQAGMAAVLWPRRIKWVPAATGASLYLGFVAGSITFFGSFGASEGLNFLGRPWWNEIRLMAIGLSGGGRPAWIAFYALVTAAAIGWIVSLIRRRADSGDEVRTVLWLFGGVVVPPAGMLVFSYVFSPAFIPRYAISALPAGALLVAFLLTRSRPLALSAALVAGVLATQVAGLVDWYRRPGIEDWRATAEFYRSEVAPGEGTLIFRYYAEAPFRYYAEPGNRRQSGTPWGLPGANWVYWWNNDAGRVIPLNDVRRTLRDKHSLWVVLAHDNLEFADGSRTRDVLLGELGEFRIEQERHFRQVWIGHYVRR